jgi:uncharacterized membrane protein
VKRQARKVSDKPGPDPVVGVGLFVVGLLIMATGGALTWHYVFNVGEGLLLLGAILFLVSVVWTSLRLEPIDWRLIARELLGRDDSKKPAP